MAPLSFRKGEKNPSPSNTSNSASNSQDTTPPSKYHPSRLLRRKASTKFVVADKAGPDSDTSGPPTGSTSSSFGEQQQQQPQQQEVQIIHVPNFSRRGSFEPVVSTTPRSASSGSGAGSSSAATGVSSGLSLGLASGSGSKPPFWAEEDGVVVIDAGVTSRRMVEFGAPIRSQTPPIPVTGPIYPTALSPPRRPTPRSPPSQTSTTLNSQHWLPSPRSGNMIEFLEAVRSTPSPGPPSPIRHITPSTPSRSETEPSPSRYPVAAEPSIRHTVSAEWLKRKPSGGRLRKDLGKGGNEVIDGPIRRRPRSPANDVDGGSSGADSDGGDVGERGGLARARSTLAEDGYEVEAFCVDRRGDGEEMKWEVTIRRLRRSNLARSQSHNGEMMSNTTSTSPLQLSTNPSIALAPTSASSINLSLSLDQPTGKLIFIAFPMDMHATPTRKRTTKEKEKEKESPRPITPPRPSTPPSAPNLANSPTTPGYRQKGATSNWPSPTQNGVSGDWSRSPVSPRAPRRTRIVSAAQLDGGLYAHGTIDGMNEDLEKVLTIDMKGQRFERQ